jgi:hypothetical protein
MKIRPVETELFHADRDTEGRTVRQTNRQSDLTKLIVAFRNSANAPKNDPKDRHVTFTLKSLVRA